MLNHQILNTPKKIREAMPIGYSSKLSELTPYSFTAINRAIKNMNDKHQAWPVIIAMAVGGVKAAREESAALGWLQKIAA